MNCDYELWIMTAYWFDYTLYLTKTITQLTKKYGTGMEIYSINYQ